jgi:hypothetical protein
MSIVYEPKCSDPPRRCASPQRAAEPPCPQAVPAVRRVLPSLQSGTLNGQGSSSCRRNFCPQLLEPRRSNGIEAARGRSRDSSPRPQEPSRIVKNGQNYDSVILPSSHDVARETSLRYVDADHNDRTCTSQPGAGPQSSPTAPPIPLTPHKAQEGCRRVSSAIEGPPARPMLQSSSRPGAAAESGCVEIKALDLSWDAIPRAGNTIPEQQAPLTRPSQWAPQVRVVRSVRSDGLFSSSTSPERLCTGSVQ